MVLISSLLFTKKFLKNYVEDFKEQFKIKNDELTNYNEYRTRGNLTFKSFLAMLFIITISVLPAIIISLHCVYSQKGIIRYLHPFVALLFSDIYMLIFVIRKFILKDSSFCTNIIIKT